MNAIRFLPLLICIVLSGCMTPAESSRIGKGAFIQGTNREDTKSFASFYFKEIDGVSVSPPSFRRSWIKPIPIGPGRRSILVWYEGEGNLKTLPMTASAIVEADIAEGVTYVVDGRNEGPILIVWVSRLDTGEKVSAEVIVSKERLKLNPPIIIPL